MFLSIIPVVFYLILDSRLPVSVARYLHRHYREGQRGLAVCGEDNTELSNGLLNHGTAVQGDVTPDPTLHRDASAGRGWPLRGASVGFPSTAPLDQDNVHTHTLDMVGFGACLSNCRFYDSLGIKRCKENFFVSSISPPMRSPTVHTPSFYLGACCSEAFVLLPRYTVAWRPWQ